MARRNSTRTTLLTNIALASLALLVLDRLVLSNYLDARRQLVSQCAAKSAALFDAKTTLQKQKQLAPLAASMGPSIHSEPAAAEGQLLHLVHDWEQTAQVSNASFQRVTRSEERGFTRLSFQISASGTMEAVAGFVYEVETSPIPLRIETANFRSKNESGDSVQIEMTISTICRRGTGAAQPPVASGTDGAGRQG